MNNPADCASRGLFPSQLISHPLWWNGPSFLHDDNFSIPKAQSFDTTFEQNIVSATTNVSILPDVSSMAKMKES